MLPTRTAILAPRKAEGLAYLLAFIACIPTANWMVGNVGTVCVPQGPCLVPVLPWGADAGPIMAPSGVLMIGLALVLRDLVQRRLGRTVAVFAIVAGAALSGAVAPPPLIVASTPCPTRGSLASPRRSTTSRLPRAGWPSSSH